MTIDVGCYYFPNYHPDPRNRLVHGDGWTEWELVKAATPRFDGHRQPNLPAWGFVDESDARVMERKIDTAADHGIDYFIFDWYWYDDGPFLQGCLESGFLGASNTDRLRFCIMWANHDWQNIHPAKLRDPHTVLYPGGITVDTFETMTDHIIRRYFAHPAYYRFHGGAYFSIYDVGSFVSSFGGVGGARRMLQRFREKCDSHGVGPLHLNAVMWGRQILPGESAPADPVALANGLGFDSVTSYVWIHHSPLGPGPTAEYSTVRDSYLSYWDEAVRTYHCPYIPNVTMGWDSTPRTVQTDRWDPAAGYPYTPVIVGNTPETFEESLRMVRDRLAAGGEDATLNINCWNEWTEGSYLEPDRRHGTAYLEAVRRVFG